MNLFMWKFSAAKVVFYLYPAKFSGLKMAERTIPYTSRGVMLFPLGSIVITNKRFHYYVFFRYDYFRSYCKHTQYNNCQFFTPYGVNANAPLYIQI